MSETPGEAESGRRVQAVQISCDIIQALREKDGAGVSELAEHLDRSKATIHSHLTTLADNEFVVKRDDSYEISLRFVDIGEYAKSQVDIYEVTKKELERLAEETGEVAQFMVEEHGRGVYLHKASGKNAIQTASYVGNRKYLHCTALGKAILSQLPEERVEQIIDRHGLPQRTENTVSTREELFDALETVRREGVAYDDEEVLQGLRCVAAPIKHANGDLHGAISISGPTSRFKGDRFHEELPEVVQGAANIIEVNATQL
ncbi:IclR family transcriptional regulator [Halobellus rufus]|uniref:IclR family transcriptional regulator n=1 Tax=Halobellus rufus TaxID=1448860 RepID=UPI0006795DB7|nr:IclR family transcriptional regulator [Halobellus rufus]